MWSNATSCQVPSSFWHQELFSDGTIAWTYRHLHQNTNVHRDLWVFHERSRTPTLPLSILSCLLVEKQNSKASSCQRVLFRSFPASTAWRLAGKRQRGPEHQARLWSSWSEQDVWSGILLAREEIANTDKVSFVEYSSYRRAKKMSKSHSGWHEHGWNFNSIS